MGTKQEMPPLPVTRTQPTMGARRGAKEAPVPIWLGEGKAILRGMEGKGESLPRGVVTAQHCMKITTRQPFNMTFSPSQFVFQ